MSRRIISSICRFTRSGMNVRNFVLAGVFSSCLLSTSHAGEGEAGVSASGLLAGGNLHLKDYIKVVLDHNEAVLAQMLGTEADRRKYCAELGIFEPNLVGNINRIANHRQNNSEQTAAQAGAPEFVERNNVYDTGLEQLLPTGGKLRFGYTLSDLGNNITPTTVLNQTTATGIFTNQWQTFLGGTLTQPLLKNGGFDATFQKIRLAALQSDIGFQTYRRQLMLTISQAEAAYWQLYFSQEQLEFVDESLKVAESVLNDSQAKVKAGKGAEIDVLEAQSGVALRRTKKNEALQRYYDALSQLFILCGMNPLQGSVHIKACDYPECAEVPMDFAESCQVSFDLNPDYLIQKQKVAQEAIRLGVARNQMLPEVNVKGAYGYNGLGGDSLEGSTAAQAAAPAAQFETSPHGSWKAVRSQNFPSWSIGLEVHVPMFGGIEGRNDYSAAKLTKQAAEVNLKGVGTQLTNAVSNSIQKSRVLLGTVRDYENVVHVREDIVKTELAQLEAGKVEAYHVLEVENDLFEARESLAEAQVQYQRSLLELELAEGSILKKRNLELTRKELRQKTIEMIKHGAVAANAPVPAPKSRSAKD